MGRPLLNVATVLPRSRTNGPGWRAAVWVQGCTRACPGCFNPSTHAHDARRLWDPEELAAHLVHDNKHLHEPPVEGITLLGGEPFEQAAACARLAREARRLGVSVVTYTGYTRPALLRAEERGVAELIDASDVLIAGPYIARLRALDLPWRGSRNQEVVLLTNRYSESDFEATDELPHLEVWTDGAAARWSGIPAEPPPEPQLSDLLLLRGPPGGGPAQGPSRSERGPWRLDPEHEEGIASAAPLVHRSPTP